MATSHDPPPLPGQAQNARTPQRVLERLGLWTIGSILIVVLGVGMLGGWLPGRATAAQSVASSRTVLKFHPKLYALLRCFALVVMEESSQDISTLHYALSWLLLC